MFKRQMRMLGLIALALALPLGCTDDGGQTGDVTTDSVADVPTTDVAPDATTDTVGLDTAPDAVAEVIEPDAAQDVDTTDVPVPDATPDVDATDVSQSDNGENWSSLGCLDVPLPAAPDPMEITVRALDFGAQTGGIEGATVSLVRRDTGAVVDTGTTDEDGEAIFSIATGGAAADVYFEFEAVGFPSTLSYTGWPLFEDEKINYALANTDFVAAVATAAGATLDATKGHIVVTARDCDLAPLEDAEFEATGGWHHYTAGEDCVTLVSDLSQTNKCGRMISINVEPGVRTVSGSVINGAEFRTQDVVVVAGGITWVTMRPDRPGP